MIKVPVPEPLTPREEVIQILAQGLCELVMRGCIPERRRGGREHWLGVQARNKKQVTTGPQTFVANR
jgi:hypothetical protein